MRVKALQKIYYNRREYKPGDEYEMEERESSEATILSKIGKIEILQSVPKYQAAALAPVEEKPKLTDVDTRGTDAPAEPTPRRRYMRRDMRAQE